MCQYSADEGRATDWHLMHLGSLAISGAGLVFIEATAVSARGRITDADLGLWDDATEVALRRVLDAVRRYSPTPIGIQLAHAGRKGSCAVPWRGGAAIAPDQPHGWQTIAPSAQSFRPGGPLPAAATIAEIDAIVADFVVAAQRADRLGCDVIELHGAHGYLLHQFLSPLSNQRTDEYGGSLENRMRLLLRVFDAVRVALPPARAVGVRIAATDWIDGGWDLEQSIVLARALDARGCSFIDVSSGGVSPAQKITTGPGYQVPFATSIKAAVSLPVIAVGLITAPAQAEQILADGHADAVAPRPRHPLTIRAGPGTLHATLGGTVVVPP